MAKIQSVNTLETEEKKKNLTNDIRRELYKTIQLMGGKSDILGIVGSWGDTLPDEDILNGLRDYNDGLTIDQLENSSK